MAKTFDERELSPVFEDPLPVIQVVLGGAPSPALLERIEARRGRRSTTEQPDEQTRDAYQMLPLFRSAVRQ